MLPKILLVLTSFGSILNSDGEGIHQTGWYLPEFAHPYSVLSSKADITIASIKGGIAPLDPNSIPPFFQDPTTVTFFMNQQHLWLNTAKVSDFLGHADDFDVLFYPGGHGPMFDVASDKDSIALVNEFWAKGKITAAVCHGPAAFVNATDPSGEGILKGRNVTGFTNAEDDAMDMSKLLPFMLEDAMIAKGGNFHRAPVLWEEKVQVDGKLITGQNPGSAMGVGKAIAEALGLS